MKVKLTGNDLQINIDAETQAKKMGAEKKDGYYERADVKIGNDVYTFQVQGWKKQ